MHSQMESGTKNGVDSASSHGSGVEETGQVSISEHDDCRVSLSEALANAGDRLERTLKELENVKIHNVCLRGTVETMHDVIQHILPANSPHAGQGPFRQQSQKAWEGFQRGFVLAYMSRLGLSLGTRLLAVAKGKKPSASASDKDRMLSSLIYSEDAARLGMFVGGYAGLYHLLKGVMAAVAPRHESLGCSLPGALAGVCLLLLPTKEARRTLALYVLARAAECTYNSLKARGLWKFPGSNWAHNDALLFAVSSAQIMYAWVMNPGTIPKSSIKFIQTAGPIPKEVIEAVRQNNRGLSVNMQALNKIARANGELRPPLNSSTPKFIPISLFHPGKSTLAAIASSYINAFKRTLPLYFSISIVPYTVFNFRRALREPLSTLWHAGFNSLRSTTFLSSFVGLYMSTVCAQRGLCAWDHKLVYWAAGTVASLAILLEKKSRRSELALYVLPRAIDSWLQILTQRKWLPDSPWVDASIFGLAMAGMMYFREKEPATMGPLIKSIITRVIFGGSCPSTKIKRPLSRMDFNFSKEDILGGALLNSGPLSLSPSNSPKPHHQYSLFQPTVFPTDSLVSSSPLSQPYKAAVPSLDQPHASSSPSPPPATSHTEASPLGGPSNRSALSAPIPHSSRPSVPELLPSVPIPPDPLLAQLASSESVMLAYPPQNDDTCHAVERDGVPGGSPAYVSSPSIPDVQMVSSSVVDTESDSPEQSPLPRVGVCLESSSQSQSSLSQQDTLI